MRAGETERAEVVRNEELEKTGHRLGLALRHGGVLDCDVFLNRGRCRVLELNPRFGGGYPFVHVAGADLPSFYIALAEKREVDPEWLHVHAGMRSAKCDRLVGLRRPVESLSGVGAHGFAPSQRGVRREVFAAHGNAGAKSL